MAKHAQLSGQNGNILKHLCREAAKISLSGIAGWSEFMPDSFDNIKHWIENELNPT